ncbi:MAG: nuclear transport factor 2 family protein [Candidatus Heimdallarchaeaceae archaeon]
MDVNKEEEKKRINYTIRMYVEGVSGFDFEKAENSWHPQGLKLFYDSDSDTLETITMLQSRPSAQPLVRIQQTAEIESIDVFGEAACVKLKWLVEGTEKKRISIDYISLLKIKNEWKIVSKIYDVKDTQHKEEV